MQTRGTLVKVPKPVVLMILDGWGEGPKCDVNAIACANPVHIESLKQNYPWSLLEASGLKVGLPEGLMGNSEVGHLNIGAGRVVYQEITRISQAIQDGTFFENRELNAAVSFARAHGGALHLMGLVSDGGVHSTMSHLQGLVDLARRRGFERVYLHAFLDGRDVPPSSALQYIEEIEAYMARNGIGQIATVMGRYWAMDRDKRWERVEKAYRAMVHGEGRTAPAAAAAVQDAYAADQTDEFIEPTIIIGPDGQPLATVKDGDAVVFFNFRADRAREITRAFVDADFDGFTRDYRPRIRYVCFTQYDVTIDTPVAFEPQNLINTLGEILAQNGIKQLRIAETEKYAHVTFFFNGGVESPNPGEDRVLIPSPKVATYDLKPEMSAYAVTDRVLSEIDRDVYDLVIMNYANADMVGHTGIMDAAVQAVQTVDTCVGRVVEKVLSKGGALIITADHGNADLMMNEATGEPVTAHTTNRTPVLIVGDAFRQCSVRQGGSLQDIAPTILKMLNLPVPSEMTGKPLITPA